MANVVALDPGTATLLSARKVGDKVVIQRMRNAFMSVRPSPWADRMLTDLKVPKANLPDGSILILGDEAFEMAATFGAELRRPMARGFLSPGEAYALPVMAAMLERMVGKGEGLCVYNVPAPPVDSDMDGSFHRESVAAIVGRCGWKARHIGEGHAVGLAELAADQFTGVATSWGGGMVNVAILYRSMPVVEFSSSLSGDWIDQQVARACAIPTPRAIEVKESGFDLTKPVGREQEAVAAYTKEAIRRTLRAIGERFAAKSDAPRFKTPPPVVLAGGTVLLNGFLDVFKACVADQPLPFTVGSVRVAPDPITSVVRGDLVCAQLEMP